MSTRARHERAFRRHRFPRNPIASIDWRKVVIRVGASWETQLNHADARKRGATYYADCYGHPHRVEGRKPILSNGGAWHGRAA